MRLGIRLIVLCLVVSAWYLYSLRLPLIDPSFHISPRGIVLYLIGDYGGFASEYRQLLARNFPHNASGPYEALLAGNLPRAQALALTSLRQDQSDVRALLTLGEVALTSGDYDQALDWLRRVLELEDAQPDAGILSAVAYTYLGDHENARDSLDRALHLYSRERITTLLHALEAMDRLERLPKKARPLCLLAHYHRYLRIYDSGQARAALAYADKAVAAGDHPDAAYLTMGIVLYREHEAHEALGMFLRAAEINPKNAWAYFWAARTYSDRGDLRREYEMRKKAFQANPKDLHRQLQWFLTDRIGDFHEALEASLERLREDADDPQALFYAGRAYHRLGDDGRAVHYYEQALAQHPKEAMYYEHYGSDLVEMGKPERAIPVLRVALDLEPASAHARLVLGNAFDDLGRYQEAAEHYEIVRMQGQLPVQGHEYLCSLYHLRLLNFERAVACYTDLLQRDPGNAVAKQLLLRAKSNLRRG